MYSVILVLLALVGSFGIVEGKPTGKELGQPLAEEDAGVDVFPAARQTNEAADTETKTVFGPADVQYSQSGGDHFVGDIQLTEEQKNNFSAMNAATNLWPRDSDGIVRIPFVVVPSSKNQWPPTSFSGLFGTIRRINDKFKGCIEFVDVDCVFCDIYDDEEEEKEEEEEEEKEEITDKVVINLSETSRCSSFVGHVGGLQDIWLSKRCLSQPYIIHQFYHTLGLWHEHQRLDRDDYVRVLWDKIPPSFRHNYRKVNGTNTYGIKYSYYSLMHYDDATFLEPERQTLEFAGSWEDRCKKEGCKPIGWYEADKYDMHKLINAYGC